METSYRHLDGMERSRIMLLRHQGAGVNSIARELGRSPATISRELRRSPLRGALSYECTHADAQAKANHYRCRNRIKLKPGDALFEQVAEELRRGWSPMQIAGRLRLMHPDDPQQRVCAETIYVALYAIPRGELRRELLACLRQGRQHRRPRSRGADRRPDRLPEELRIAARPEDVTERLVPGHWEGDLIKGAYNRSSVGTLVERSSRLVMITRMAGNDALSAQQGFEQLLGQVPPELRKSLTYDRGTEMARHAELTKHTGVKVYFADPYSPWQRGSNENMNGLIRQYLPKGTDLSVHTQESLDYIAYLLNNRPRKVLGFRTPWEVYRELMDQARGTPQA